MAYNPKHYVVEFHLGMDVLHKDYGSNIAPAKRAFDRICKMSDYGETLTDVRVWFGKNCVATKQDGWR